MTWVILSVYIVVLLMVCLRIVYETHSNTKTMAYLLFCFFIPVIGLGFYLTFGINYWRKKLYQRKTGQDEKILEQIKKHLLQYAKENEQPAVIEDDTDELAVMLTKTLQSPLTHHNRVKILLNGEEKFPELLQAIAKAKHHIHMEYYIYEQEDAIGTEVIELLIKKAKEGVEVRFIYDDFGSPSIKNKVEKRMQDAGIEIYPFHKVHFYLLANRINYRNHRKIVVIDGHTGFTGGINVSDKYINNGKTELFWRDTHLCIEGPGVFYLQYIFIADWNFCSPNKIKPDKIYFEQNIVEKGNTAVQITSSGPDSTQPAVLFTILQAIYLAKEEILIATPYFIPGDSILDALRIAALSGLKVKLLVPGKCDSKLVNAASKANYNDLLQAGVEIYIYQKGFVHAKTLVTDAKLSMVGTANMDHRSFQLNFEVNAIIYDIPFAKKMRTSFFNDLKDAEKLDAETWYKRSFFQQLPEKLARLFSPAL